MLDATERRVLSACAFTAGCLLLLPRQWVSAGVAFALALGIFVWHVARSRKESERAEPRGAGRSEAGGSERAGG
jgi:membrane protein implicated in regulation of membrane protease activity